jgi:hypothetical protein
MAKQQVIWTALPNGIVQVGSTRRLRLSVFLSPRLQPDEAAKSLEPFDFLDWPARLQPGRVVFDVLIDDGTRMRAEIDKASPTPDSRYWRALFDQQTFVERHEFAPPLNGLGHTYHVSPILSTLKAGYQQIAAAAPHGAPNAQTVGNAFPGLMEGLRPSSDARAPRRLDVATAGLPDLVEHHANLANNLLRLDDPASLAERIAAAVTAAKHIAAVGHPTAFVEVVRDTGSAASQFAQLVAFHHPAATGLRSSSRPTAVNAAGEPAPIDFHQMLAALKEYPALLRLLGLVIDLQIDAQALPASSSDHPKGLQVIPTFTPPLTPPAADNAPPYTPLTRYLLDLQSPLPVFAAAGRPPGSGGVEPEVMLGLLNLHRPSATNPLARRFEIVQVDVDGAVFKTLDTLSILAGNNQQPHTSTDAPGDSSPPSSRTSGLSIVQANYADVLQQDINGASRLEDTFQRQEQAELFAEDLVRGYRVDVFDSASKQWHSLHKRVGTYTFPRAESGLPPLLPIADEGFVHPALTHVAAADGTPPVPRVHESLFHWHGWSLAAARPGIPVETSRPTSPPEDARPAGGLQLDVGFEAAAGSLPRLRFGLDYQLRVRTVDLAGNGLSLDQATEVLKALDAQGQPSPALPRHIGEFTYRRFEPISAPVLVLCEELTEGESPERLVIRSNAGVSADAYAGSLGDPKYQRANQRHVAPPKTSQHMVETHGLLDDSFGTGAAGFERTYSISTKEQGSFNDTSILDIEDGKFKEIPDTMLVDPRTGATSTVPHSVRFIKTQIGDDDHTGYSVHYEPKLKLPYLPDPLARGTALFGLPGMPLGKTLQLDQSGQLETVNTALPQATIEALGLVTKIDFGPNWPERLPFRLQLREGSDPPSWDPASRVLTVQLPKAETATIRFSAYTFEDDLSLLGVRDWLLEFLRTQPGTPTLKLALEAAASGAVSMLSPSRALVLVHAVQQPLFPPRVSLNSPAPRDPHATFAYLGGQIEVDAKSTAKLDLLASWHEPIDGPEEVPPRTVAAHVFELPLDLDGKATQDDDPVPIALFEPKANRVQLLAPSSPAESQRRRFLSRHEFGDTRFREVAYRAVATTRFREYFPATLTSNPDKISRTSAEVKIKVLSSAAPAPPHVLYVLPTFRWTKPSNPLALRQDRVRSGGGLRVYLARPWFSSGAGEQLGVVCSKDELDTSMTVWGGDPIFAPVGPDGTTSKSAIFKNGQRSDFPTLTVFGHAVHFDEERELWYSDIVIDVGNAYAPFVRLALARYQPNSIPDAERSTIVLADMVQLAPDRTVSLISNAAERDQLTVTVAGVTYRDITTPNVPTRPPITALVEVSLEQRTVPGTQDDLGWTPADPALQPQPALDPLVAPLLWNGRVTLPTPRTPNQFRLVVKEFEQLPTGITTPLTLIKRLVFADTVELRV